MTGVKKQMAAIPYRVYSRIPEGWQPSPGLAPARFIWVYLEKVLVMGALHDHLWEIEV